jgi:serine/threonine-protein kinase RsbW
MNRDFTLILPPDLRFLHLVSRVGFKLSGDVARSWGKAESSAFSDAFELALSEAYTNSVKHGRGNGLASDISIDFKSGPDSLTIRIKDSNPPFSLEYSPPSGDDRYRSSGYGLYIIHRVMDDVRYSRENGCNVMTLSKSFQSCG